MTCKSVRMAIGQLADYRRFVDPQIQALLVPSQPRPDLLTLLGTEGISVIWEVDAKFEGQGHAAEQLFGIPAGAWPLPWVPGHAAYRPSWPTPAPTPPSVSPRPDPPQASPGLNEIPSSRRARWDLAVPVLCT